MRVLYASERPPYPFFLGGAARCAHQLLTRLSAELGVGCAAAGSADYSVAPWSYPDPSEYPGLGVKAVGSNRRGGLVDCGYPVHALQNFHDSLEALVDEFQPDVLWTQLEGARPLLEMARNKGIQGLYYVHDAETPPPELRAIADLDCHVVCSSAFLADKVRTLIGRQAPVVYPCPDLHFDTQGDPDGFITMINPHRVKGLHTFVAIAKQIPSERFLLLESWKLTDQGLADLKQLLRDLPNVRFTRRVSEMRSIYAQTKLLLVPSVWEEGFGMVAVEAQSCRIPVIASARGGLLESVGDGGTLIRDYLEPNAWVKAIREVLDDKGAYDRLADRALRHAHGEAFTASYSALRFYEVCSGPVSRESAYARGVNALTRRVKGVSAFRAFFGQRGR